MFLFGKSMGSSVLAVSFFFFFFTVKGDSELHTSFTVWTEAVKHLSGTPAGSYCLLKNKTGREIS
jgi:hypothetical protein